VSGRNKGRALTVRDTRLAASEEVESGDQ